MEEKKPEPVAEKRSTRGKSVTKEAAAAPVEAKKSNAKKDSK